MRTPEFAAMIGPARLYPQLWRLLLGILLILFIYIGFFALMLVVLYPLVGPIEYFGWLLKLQNPTEPGPTLFLLISFIGMFLAPVIAVAACHFRGPGTLFGPRGETLRGFFLALAVLFPVYGALGAANWVMSPPDPNLPLDSWLRYLPAAVLLVLIQVTAEELIFRGYLPQQLAARFAARWVWMGVPAVIFAMLHYNPQAGGNAWLIVGATLAFALIATDLTEQTGSLGAAIGLHFTNNLFALLFVGVKGTITGLSLYITPFDVSDGGPLGFGLAIDLIMLLIIWRLLRFVLVR